MGPFQFWTSRHKQSCGKTIVYSQNSGKKQAYLQQRVTKLSHLVSSLSDRDMLTCVLVCIEKSIAFLRVRDIFYSPIQYNERCCQCTDFKILKEKVCLSVMQNNK